MAGPSCRVGRSANRFGTARTRAVSRDAAPGRSFDRHHLRHRCRSGTMTSRRTSRSSRSGMSEARPGGPGDDGCAGAAHQGNLRDPARLRALEYIGLGPEPDPDMDYFAGWVRRALGVPVALVSLVEAERQVFPGMSGLPEPWASKRSTPLSHSFCRHVVVTAQPLVIADARAHPLGRDNLAVPD